MANLVTFGAQHNGIAKFQECGTTDWVCKAWQGVLRGNTWGDFVQGRLVPAQYFRNPEDLDAYLESSNFLADINNEREMKNATYRENMMRLEKFAMYLFSEDQTVVPKESSWFAEVNGTTGEVTNLTERAVYKEDWLGLKALDEAGKLDFKVAEGSHMQLSDELLKETFREYFSLMTKKR